MGNNLLLKLKYKNILENKILCKKTNLNESISIVPWWFQIPLGLLLLIIPDPSDSVTDPILQDIFGIEPDGSVNPFTFPGDTGVNVQTYDPFGFPVDSPNYGQGNPWAPGTFWPLEPNSPPPPPGWYPNPLYYSNPNTPPVSPIHWPPQLNPFGPNGEVPPNNPNFGAPSNPPRNPTEWQYSENGQWVWDPYNQSWKQNTNPRPWQQIPEPKDQNGNPIPGTIWLYPPGVWYNTNSNDWYDPYTDEWRDIWDTPEWLPRTPPGDPTNPNSRVKIYPWKPPPTLSQELENPLPLEYDPSYVPPFMQEQPPMRPRPMGGEHGGMG